MKRSSLPRYLSLALLLAYLISLTACISLTNFVVVNSSDSAIEVRYKLKRQGPPVKPGILPASQLDQQVAWRELSASEFKFDPDTHIAVCSLKPGEALWVDQLDLEDGPADRAADFAISEITLTGAHGEIKLEGEQAYKSFVAMSKTTYVLMYK